MVSTRPILTAEEIWRRYDRTEARLTAPLSERMIALAGLRPGTRVLDLATGRGEPAVLAARKVGANGFVLGIDVSASMLEMARESAARQGASNLELRVANAESLDGVPVAHFDSTLVRWGLMYMAWENDLIEAAEPLRRNGFVRLGAVTRIVVASPE